jgi:TniQ
MNDLGALPLPFAPRPLPDELLLSWVCRLAAANHVRLDLFFPELERTNRYRLNCDPGESVILRLATMARLPASRVRSLLLPNQFPNLPSLSFLEVPAPEVLSHNEDSSASFPLTFCLRCASEEGQQSLYWQAEEGLLTTVLCPKHGTCCERTCPRCRRLQLTLAWNEDRLVVRCQRCSWRPAARFKREKASPCPSGSRQVLFRLQQDIVAALRGEPPSDYWFGRVTAAQFLGVVDDLYWLLRTPGLSADHRQEFTFVDIFSWASHDPEPRIFFYRSGYWPFSAWSSSSRSELLLALAITMLGRRAFDILGCSPHYPGPSTYYPLDWIFPTLRRAHAQELRRRAARWPAIMRLPLLVASGMVENPFPDCEYSTS